MNKNMILVLSLFLSSYAFANDFGQCNSMFPNSKAPDVPQKNVRELCFNDFAVEYSVDSKTPVYSVERLNYLTMNGPKEKRTNHFHEEPMLRQSERSTLEDYKGSGLDRGHMAPAGDRKNPVAMEESFSLSNMIPQNPTNNRSAWAKNVEAPTRKFAMRAQGDVYVFTGPYFSPNHKTIGPHHVWVPDFIFKLVYDKASGRSWAFWVENTARVTKPISYDELVVKTGIHFLK
jgi:endonuclease G